MSTKIQWTDVTWNPVRGCSRVSDGCRNCYAESVARRFSGPGLPYEGLIAKGGQWNGKIRLAPEKLDEPLRWRKPRRVFVNSMSDLFHESIPDEFIAHIFTVMSMASRHKFQVLTKRPRRMLQWVRNHTSDCGSRIDYIDEGRGRWRNLIAVEQPAPWPLPNVHLGVSVENQETTNERIPLLLQTPAAVRWVSAEPLLGAVTIFDLDGPIDVPDGMPSPLHWVVAGGESGPAARECGVQWIRDIVQQCKGASVPVFVKQLGAQPVSTWPNGDVARSFYLHDRKGGDPSEWPADLRVREWPA